jgi:hypothetical protein
LYLVEHVGANLPNPSLDPARTSLLIGPPTRICAEYIAEKGFTASDPIMTPLAITAYRGCPIAVTILVPVPVPMTVASIIVAAAHLK